MSKSAEGIVEWASTWRGKARPKIEITNAKWDKQEARRGDVLKLTADVKGVKDNTEVQIEIWEHDADGNHDLIEKFSALVKNRKVEAEWEFKYGTDTDEIPTAEESDKGYNQPEHFFRVKIDDHFGESGLLKFKDWIEIELVDEEGDPVADEDYILHLPDGQERKGKLNSNGYAKEEDVPPGKIFVEFPNLEGVDIAE